jgi:hypothetical protein
MQAMSGSLVSMIGKATDNGAIRNAVWANRSPEMAVTASRYGCGCSSAAHSVVGEVVTDDFRFDAQKSEAHAGGRGREGWL